MILKLLVGSETAGSITGSASLSPGWWFGFLICLVLITGCPGSFSNRPSGEGPSLSTLDDMAPDKLVLIIFRDVNFAGEGRIHELQLDHKTLGPLKEDNYYRLELWPGNYYLNIHLPSETFLGETKAEMNVGRHLKLGPHLVGQTLVYHYIDGQGLTREEEEGRNFSKVLKTKMLKGRQLALDLPASASAHVTRYLDTDYDGPSLNGRPHGRGVLSWDDGCRYDGIFIHGQVSPEGRFYFKDGRMFMGQLYKGRPNGSGVLLSTEEEILYAGPFEDEQPHGLGLRMGDVGPEYCRYDHGRDITKTVFQLAVDAVDQLELVERSAMQWLTFVEPYGDWVQYLRSSEDVPDPAAGAFGGQTIVDLKLRRRERITHMVTQITEEQKARIEKERFWCDDELANGRDWCICAPFNPLVVENGSCMR